MVAQAVAMYSTTFVVTTVCPLITLIFKLFFLVLRRTWREQAYARNNDRDAAVVDGGVLLSNKKKD